MDDKSSTYERLRGEVSSLEKAPDSTSRRLVWVTPERSLAVSRDSLGRLEVFIGGEPLTAATKTVADLLDHQVWQADDGSDVPATRVVLPRGDHFDQVGALLCVELVDHGVDKDQQAAFTAVEPLIALALTRETVSDLTLMGLIGELAFLESLLSASAPEATRDVLRSWAGSAPSARDFQIGSVGIEVKTTQGASSTHHVEGVHQVELGRSNEDVLETELFMLSLGVAWISGDGHGRSLPELVDSILSQINGVDDRADLLARIKQYGGDAALGYDHERDHGKARFSTRFYFRFERLYDMTDERLRILTSATLSSLTNVDPSSVRFRVLLPDRVRGERNPVTGWGPIARAALAAGGLIMS